VVGSNVGKSAGEVENWTVFTDARDSAGRTAETMTPRMSATAVASLTRPSTTFQRNPMLNAPSSIPMNTSPVPMAARGGIPRRYHLFSVTASLPLGGETYTFDDTARLSVLPGRILFYRVRLVP
jgi:hypothetical protein